MKFRYVGVTRQKEEVNGVIEATDELEAKMKLRGLQIRTTSLAEESEGGGWRKALQGLPLTSPVSLKKIMVFTRQFSSLVDSGVAIVQCLDILHQQEAPGPFKVILKEIQEDIESGGGFAQALSKHPHVFSEFFIRIVEAGELSGTLDVALRRVGVQLEKLSRLRAKVIGALTYPAITVLISIGVLVFLLVKVIPEIAKLYSSSNAQLPAITTFVLGMSDWLRENYLQIFFGLVVSIVSGIVLYRNPAFREAWDPFALKIPLFGPLIRKSAVARLTRTLSTLISSGVPLLTAFEICVKLMNNFAIRHSIERTARYVSEGETIVKGLSQDGLFPPMVIHMVNIGEMTGKLDELLSKVADIYDEEVDDAVNNLTGLLQPIIIVFVGGMIAFLLMAMYLPIFQLADKLGS